MPRNAIAELLLDPDNIVIGDLNARHISWSKKIYTDPFRLPTVEKVITLEASFTWSWISKMHYIE